MTVKQKYEYIERLEKDLKSIIEVIEIIDPIRNDTDSNNYTDNGVEMVRIPRFKSWLIRAKGKLSLKVHRVIHSNPITLDLSNLEVIDCIGKILCEKRDWYRNKIEEIDKSK